jgi:hypothetical protein
MFGRSKRSVLALLRWIRKNRDVSLAAEGAKRGRLHIKSLTSHLQTLQYVFSHSVPTVASVRAFSPLIIHQIKPSWTV